MSATTTQCSHGSLVISQSSATSGVLSLAAPAPARGHARAKDDITNAPPQELLPTPPHSTTVEVNQNMSSTLPAPSILESNATASTTSLASSHPPLINVHPSTQLKGMQSIAESSKGPEVMDHEKNSPYGPWIRNKLYLTQSSVNLPLSSQPSTCEPSSMPSGPLRLCTNIEEESSSVQMNSPSEYSRPPSLSEELVDWTKAVHWAESTFESETPKEWIQGYLERKSEADHDESEGPFKKIASLTRMDNMSRVKSIGRRLSCRRYTTGGRLEHGIASNGPAIEPKEQGQANSSQDESNRYSGTTVHTRPVSSNELQRQGDKTPPVRRHYLPFESSSTLQNHNTPRNVEGSPDLPKDSGSPKSAGYLGRLLSGSLRGQKKDSPRRRRRATTNALASYSIGLQRQTSFKLSCLIGKFHKERKH